MNSTRFTRRGFGAAAVGGLFALAVVEEVGAQGKTLVVKGSDTMVNLSQAWAEAYMEAKQGSQISVTGGGTGTGIAALINGTCNICNASREMTDQEVERVKQKGFIPIATVCGLDGLAIAVNSGNSLSKISIAELGKIYAGGVDDWSKLGGGKSGKIVVLSRESSSGTYVYFRDNVLKGKNYRSDALLMPSTKAIATEVAKNPNAIGYGGEAYFRGKPGIKVIPVSAKPGGEAVMPSDETVRSKKYPIARELYMYTPGKPSGLASDFIKFCLSSAGQKIVGDVGYTPLK